MADNYTQLWKLVKDARQKDLPKTEIKYLKQIATKAERERQYGQLIKAELLRGVAETSVSPDSGEVALARLEQRAGKASDPAVKAVYAAVLSSLWQTLSQEDNDSAALQARQWRKLAMADPAMLARHKAADFEPAVVTGIDSEAFGGDLLHVIGLQLNDFDALRRYYDSAGNHRAACLCAAFDFEASGRGIPSKVKGSAYLQRIDSLLTVYGDVQEAGALATLRYNAMHNASDVSAEEKVSFINEALKRWGAWKGINELRNALSELQQPNYRVVFGDRWLLPGKKRTVKLTDVRNLAEVTLNIYRVNVDGNTQLSPDNDADWAQLRKRMNATPVQTLSRRFATEPQWAEHEDSVTLEPLPVGVYIVEATTSAKGIKPMRELLHVSNLYLLRQGLPDDKIRLAVVDATTGSPVAGAHILLTYDARSWRKTPMRQTTLTTNAGGETDYSFGEQRPDRIWVYTDNDRACIETNGSVWYASGANERQHHNLNLFTDRAIYRPGQTIHVAALAWDTDDDKLASTPMKTGSTVTFILRDANYKTVEEKSATVDDYGTAAIDFVLPQNGLTGAFTLYASVLGRNAYAGISVEQYKRPTFRVSFDPYKEAYHAGDTISVRGKAETYSGVPVQGARVSFTVNRKPAYWWFWRSDEGNEQVAADSTTTADDGSFTIRVPLQFPETADLNSRLRYSFNVNAKVTDQAGETHEGDLSLPLSNRTAFLTTDLPEQVLRDSLRSMTFNYRNVAGETVSAKVRYRFDGGAWQEVDGGQPVVLKGKLSSGLHHLEAQAPADTLKQDVVVFSMDDRKPATTTHDWYYLSASQFPGDGKPVFLQVGASDKGTQLFYTVVSGKKVIDRGSRAINDEVITKRLTYKPEYGDGITIALAWVVDGKAYTHQAEILRPVPDRQLRLTWKSFRDRLTPGQKETWTLQVASPNGKPAEAQLLATMYDKSLDAIRKHQWSFSNSFSLAVPYAKWQVLNHWALNGLYGSLGYKSLDVPDPQFSHFDTDMFNWLFDYATDFDRREFVLAAPMGEVRQVKRKTSRLMSKQTRANVMYDMVSASEAAFDEDAVAADSVAVDEDEEPTKSSDAALRENLNETAFFFPTLTTDSKGVVTLQFTLPESLTTWQFMGLAHDKAFNYGLINAETVAQKSVMVTPNVPRFLREGDKAQLSTRIFNTTDKPLSGKARLVILDPETDKVLMELSQPFNVDAKATATADFRLDADALAQKAGGQTLLVARVLAEGNGFSDGEQHYLPLLPNREQVVTTVPFNQHGAGTKTIDVAKLFPEGAKAEQLTVEYTNNPAWLVLQALPTLANPRADDALSLAAAIYANAIGRSVLNASPRIAQTIKLWQQEKGTETSLQSNLEKDQELKNLVLDETPWVADANHEADQKRQLAGFLDASTIDNRLNSFTAKLKKLQNADGSFSWWPGMEGSTYMTLAVVKTLVRLNAMVGTQDATAPLIRQGFSFLDSRMAKEVAELKRMEKKGVKSLCPSESACDYLYANALAKRPATADINYLVGLLAKMPTALTIYGKANSAVILAQYGHKQRAAEYLQSLNEYAVYKEEMGRYFDAPRAYYSWFDYRIPTQVAAIEAMKRLQPGDSIAIDDMQRWLLAAKRTQAWDTPLCSVDAVYAFLTDNSGKTDMRKLATEEATVLKADGKSIALPKATAGIGYVKTTLPTTTRQVEAVKTSTGTSWGAVYARFRQKATEVTSAGAGLSVRREVLVSNNGKTAKAGRTLKVGDKVTVRITISADRDYDFVMVQDKRAACIEPVGQLSGYHWGYYCAPQDNATNYYFDRLSKGKHVVETTYYVDRAGDYASGICTVQCAYAPEFSGREAAKSLSVEK